MAERKTLRERLFGPSRNNPKTQQVKENKIQKTQDQLMKEAINLLDDKKIEEAKDLIRGIETTQRTINFESDLANLMTEEQLFEIYRQMDNDSIISSALDLFADNATQVNTKTGHVISVESNDKAFQDEVNSFLWDTVNVDTEAWNWVRAIAMYGKVVLDTKASNGGADWAFIEVDKPEHVLPLTYGQDNIKYHAVIKGLEEKFDQSSFYSGYQASAMPSESDMSIVEQDRYLVAFNARKHLGKMVVETTSPITHQSELEELYVRGGKSFLEGIIETWRMLSTLEDSMFISRLVKSKAFNLVTIDVSDTNSKQSEAMVNSVKKSLRSAETIDKTAERYTNRTSPIPAHDFIYVPVKGEKGGVSITQVGGETGTQDLSDIEWYRNKLFAGLGVLKAYLGFEETTPGGLGETTLTMLDERLSRKVKRLRQSLHYLSKQIVVYYWTNSARARTLENIPQYDIILGKISTQEEAANRDELLENISVANEILNLTSAFPDKVDEDKLFQYIFNDVIGIDPSNFDNIPEAKEIVVVAKQLDENDVNKIVEQKLNQQSLIESRARRVIPKRHITKKEKQIRLTEGTIKDFLENQPITKVLEEYAVYLINEKNQLISLHSALDDKYLRKSLTEATYKELKAKSKTEDPQRIKKSKKLIGKYLGLDENNYIVFQITAEDPAKNRSEGKPTSYETKVHLKALIEIIEARRTGQTDLSIVQDAVKDNIAVSCECPAYTYWGPAWRGTQEDYAIEPNNIAPTVRPPVQPICKHLITALTIIPFWTNTIVRDLRRKGLLTSTSQSKKDKVKIQDEKELVVDEVKEEVKNEVEKQIVTKEDKIKSKAPRTIKKKPKVEEEEVDIDEQEIEVEEL